MLADEVTHVKMGSDWLRRLTAKDPERQKQALDFQRTVDKLFSFGGFRGEEEENPVHLARKFRGLAGFTDDEITDLVDIAAEAYAEAQAQAEAAAGRPSATPDLALYALVAARPPRGLGVVRHHRQRARRARGRSAANWLRVAAHARPVVVHRRRRAGDLRAGGAGRRPGRGEKLVAPQFHMFYGFVAIIAVGIIYSYRAQLRSRLLPALRLRRPVPDGPRHPRPARRPHLTGFSAFSSGEELHQRPALEVDDRAGERAGDAVDHLDPADDHAAEVVDRGRLGLRDHVVGAGHVVGGDDAVDRADLGWPPGRPCPTSVWMRMYALTAMPRSVGGQPARRFSSSMSSARSSRGQVVAELRVVLLDERDLARASPRRRPTSSCCHVGVGDVEPVGVESRRASAAGRSASRRRRPRRRPARRPT